MNKQELMENYTLGELADMVILLRGEIKLFHENANKQEEQISELKSELDEKKNLLQSFKVLAADNSPIPILKVKDIDDACVKAELLEHDVEELRGEIDKSEAEVQYYKEETMKLKEENEELRHDNEELSEFFGQFPGEPIQIAEWLIGIHMDECAGAVHDICESCNGVMPEGVLEKIRENAVSNLRQVANHLIIYCDSNRKNVWMSA